MGITIKTIEIRNFRNIKTAHYDLSDKNCFVGKNHVGKTNILQAISWVLTDKFIDGSNDVMSIKPKDNSKELVSVTLVINNGEQDLKIEKTYQEKWTKNRGSNELTLTGHETIYKFNDLIEKRISDSIVRIQEFLGITLDKYFKLKSVDMIQALMNPLYFAKILDWKELRKLITSIIGELSNESVFEVDKSLIAVKSVLERYNYNHVDCLKYLNQQVKALKEQKTTSQNIYQYLEDEINKLSLLDCDDTFANEKLEEIIQAITRLKESKDSENPIVTNLKNEINNLNEIYKKNYEKELQLYKKEMEYKNKEIESLKVEKEKADSDFDVQIQKQTDVINAEVSAERQYKSLENEKDILEEKIKNLYQDYDIIDAECFVANIQKCPHCNYILNSDEIEENRKKFEETKAEKLDNIRKIGKATRNKIDSIKFELEELRVKIHDYKNENSKLTTIVNDLTEMRYSIANKISLSMEEIKIFTPGKDTQDILTEIERLKRQIERFQKNNDDEQNQLISVKKLEEQKKPYLEIINRVNSIKSNQQRMNEKQAEIDSLNNKIIETEIAVNLVDKFSKVKLQLLDTRIKETFGDELRIKLIESNITEGSWNQVCYPLIGKSNVAFKDGSTSEKVITGVNLLTAIKNALGLPSMPILIDEIGELDNFSLETIKYKTKSQLITTKVNDEYSSPKLEIL